MITAVKKVVVPVEDQERAKEFWTARIGFEVVRDDSYGDERWIEVSPPGGGVVLVLSPRSPDQPRPEVDDRLPHSPIFFNSDDIQRTYEELRERGVEFAAPPAQMPFGWWALFTDQEGTRYALGQWA